MAERAVDQARGRLLEVEKALNSAVVGREVQNRLLLTTVVAGENLAIIGPPGTAKSYSVRILSKLLDCSFAAYQFHKHTRDYEVLGAFDIKKLINDGELKRRLSRLLQADIAYFDEAFKASSAVLNTLLSALQERVIYDPLGGTEIPVKTKFFVVTSNETPQEEELQALYDRFPVRVFVGYLDDDALLLQALEARWLNGSRDLAAVASWGDVETLQGYAAAIIGSAIKGLNKPFLHIYHASTVSFVKSLRSRGVVVSDRTIIEKLPKLVAAQCALYGLTIDNVTNAVIDFLPHLGRDPGEYEAIKKAIFEDLGEVAELHDKIQRAKAAAKAGNLQEALNLLEEVKTFDVSRIASKPWLKQRVEAVVAEANALYGKYAEIKATLEAMAQQ